MKKISKKILSIFLAISLIIGSIATSAIASDDSNSKNPSDGIVLKISTEKKNYKKGEDITFNVDVKNTTEENKTDIDVKIDCNWFNFDIEEGSSINIKQLNAGETKTIQFHAKYLRLNLFEFVRIMFQRLASWFARTLFGSNSETTRYSVRVGLIKRLFVFSVEVGGTAEADDPEDYEDIDTELDTDNDGVPDYMENLFGSDIYSNDTDGDGLSDFIEIYVSATEPTLVDSDSDGISDGDEDCDNDGLTNLEEIDLGTIINKSDSDNDGLGDNDELTVYKTDPKNPDTDSDKVSDGKEIELGTDPLVPEDSFDVSYTAKDEDSVEVSVGVLLSGEQVETLSVDKVENETLFPETIPGYIGGAYDFSVDGTFDSATISFTFDESLNDDKDFDPVIYYFNEEKQELEPLETTVSGNTASTVTTHFSTYILINRKVFEKSFTWEDVWEDSKYEGIEIVFVIDDSGSMSSNDRSNQRLAVASTLIEKLPDESKIGIVKFGSSTSMLTSSLITDKSKAKSYLTSSYFKSSGGTKMYSGISSSFGLFDTNSEKILKMIVVLTDGDTSDTGMASSVINTAIANNVKVYTVGLGSSTSYFNSYLKPLANQTNGVFYLASDASQLSTIYENIGKKIERELDSDGDGIPNWYEDTIIAFNGTKIKMDKNKPDTDGDGLLDSEEVKLQFKYNDDKTKVQVIGKMNSNPYYIDTDFDGTDDNLDSKKLDNNFTGKMHYDYDTKDKTCDVEFKVDYRNLLNENNKSYSKDLSVFSMLLASDIYEKNYIETTSGAKIGGSDSGDNLELLAGLDAEPISIGNDSSIDKDDVTDITIGHKNYPHYGDNDEEYEVIVLSIRGTNKSNSEWSSNFDVGADTNEYYSMTGEHPEWVNKENHKGFDVTANRVLKEVDNYLNSNISPSANKVILITGHSRGAAIANLIGKEFEDRTEYTSFTYTFAAPNCTTADETIRKSYKSIFNIINLDDMIPMLPLESWGFGKYGTIKSISVKNEYENRFGKAEEGTFEWLVGKDYNNDSGTQRTLNAFAKIASNRTDLYKIDTSSDGKVWENNSGHKTYADAQDELKTLTKELESEKLLRFCNLYIVSSSILGVEKHHVEVNYCPAYLMQTLSNMTTKVGPLLGRDVNGKYSTAKRNFVESSGSAKIPRDVKGIELPLFKDRYGDGMIGGMTDPHMQPTYYLIAHNDFKIIK